MTTLEQRVGRFVDPALPTLELPRRVPLVGRTGVGKTTLLNALTGGGRPTGLGGVTRQVEAVHDGDRQWLDTPGIDGRERAIDALGDALTTAHRLVWVVDGLQPVTRTERDVLELLVDPGLTVDVVVSRADLVPDDLAGILARVREHTRFLRPRTLVARDLRRAPDPDHLRASSSTPGERQTRIAALEALLPRLHGARPLEASSLADLVTVRPAVRDWLGRVSAEESTVAELVQRFGPELQALADDAVIRWAADPRLRARITDLPRLPPVPDPARSTLDGLRWAAAGWQGAFRELRGVAASWAAEAELALADWREGQSFDDSALVAHTDAIDAVSAELRELRHEDDQSG